MYIYIFCVLLCLNLMISFNHKIMKMKNKKHFNSLLFTFNFIMQLLCFHWLEFFFFAETI